jgi:hypothetical protein
MNLFLPGNSPTELKRDPRLSRLFLKEVDDWILREAERRDDCWKFLRGVRGLSPECRDFLRVADSVSQSAQKLGHIQYGGATLHRSLIAEIQKLKATGDEQGAERVARKLFRAQYRSGAMWQDLSKHCKDPEELLLVKRVIKEEDEKLVKRHGHSWQNEYPYPTQEESERTSTTEFLMVHAWLRWGVDEPGLCFYSDEALAELIVILVQDEARYGPKTRTVFYRKLRQRLGLDYLNYRKPTVTEARRVPGTGLIDITVRTSNRSHKHRLSKDPPCIIGGRQIYPIPS